MPLEIERKFLVVGDSWRALCSRTEHLKDGLVAASIDRKVRVRVYGGHATIAIKSKRIGNLRSEFEYEIPVEDAEALLELCGQFKLEKKRHHIDHKGSNWVVDEYEGILDGITIAEIEMDDVNSDVVLPDWVGCEITNDDNYRKIKMLTSRLTISPNDARLKDRMQKCILCYSEL